MPSEAVTALLPFEPLEWASADSAIEEAHLTDVLGYNAVLSSKRAGDEHHALAQYSIVGDCGSKRWWLKRLVNLTTGQTLAAYRVTNPCTTGPFAPEAAMVGGFTGKEIEGPENPSFMMVGTRKLGDSSWIWWPRALPLLDVFGAKFHDLADGTLVMLNQSIRVAAPGSMEFEEIDDGARVGAAVDDRFIWAKLLMPSGANVRVWSRAGGVQEAVHQLSGDPCGVTASMSHVVGINAEGSCTGFLRNLQFWRLSLESLGVDSAVVDGPAVGASMERRIGFRKLQSYGDYAVAFAGFEDEDSFFLLVARFSDRTLWRIDPRDGKTFFSSANYTLAGTHIYVMETVLGYNSVRSARRIPLASLEMIATPLSVGP